MPSGVRSPHTHRRCGHPSDHSSGELKVVLAKRRVTQASAKVTTELVPEASAKAVTQVAKRSAPSARRSAPHYKRVQREPLPSSLRPEGSTASVQPLRAKRSREPQAMLELVLEHPTMRRRKRASIGSNFDSQAEMEAAKRGREVDELVALIPPAVAETLLGGKLATQQVSDANERARLLADAVALKAGPDGATLGNAVRAWSAYAAYAADRHLPGQGLPGTAALVASFLKAEAQRAAKGTGSQGGTSVANSRRVGLLWLQEKLGFPLSVDNIVVLAAANPGQIRAHHRADPVNRRRKQAGSLPIRAYAQFETLASATQPSPTRYFARSMVAFSLIQSVRAVDALRTVEDADQSEPDTVMSGWSYFSKDGEPMRTFAPAAGFLGPLTWWPQHSRDVRKARVFPKWNQPYGSGGRVTEATGPPLRYVMPKAHLVASIEACLKAKPLQLSDAAFKALGLSAHSEHGSPSDMLATIGPHSHLGSFIREDVREIGHWLRLGKLEDDLEGGSAGAQSRRRGALVGRQAFDAFANNAAESAARYCEGDGREGRRSAQLRVRKSWVDSVRKALAQWARPWTELPDGRADYRILEAEPPTEDP